MQGLELLQSARKDEARFYLLFGGQGTGWLKELQGYFQDPSIKPLIDLCLEAIREELPYLEPGVALPYGLDVETWLMDQSRVPSPEYLSCAGVSVPLIFITQLACVWNLHTYGLDLTELLSRTGGSSGQSQGLCTASLISLGLTGSAFDEAVRKFAKLLFFIGTRAQEIYPFIEPTEEERERSSAVNDWRNTSPTPMVAIVGADYNAIAAQVSRFNSKVAPDKRIHISLNFSKNRVVLSGHRSSLIEFNAWHRTYFADNGIKYVYIRTTCPFHSAMMEPIRPQLEADLARIRFEYSGSELKIPVYSFYDGRNLQDDEQIAINLYLDVLINRLEWRRALEPVLDDAITHVIDFGPGNENQHVSRRLFEEMGCDKPIFSARTMLRKTLQP